MDKNPLLTLILEDVERVIEALDITETDCDGTAKIIAIAFAAKVSKWQSDIQLHLDLS